jgi:chemotaxis family two-component system response regulator Rcp1
MTMASALPFWRILLVEDSLADICLLRLALKDAGPNFELTVLHDGAEALAFVRGQGKYADTPRPDLVVLDQMLPKHDGTEVMQAIRSSERMKRIPVVLMTSVAPLRHSATNDTRGIDHQIIKPLNLQEYLNIGVVLRDILLETRSQRVSGAVGASGAVGV